jgi:hypothetical protein
MTRHVIILTTIFMMATGAAAQTLPAGTPDANRPIPMQPQLGETILTPNVRLVEPAKDEVLNDARQIVSAIQLPCIVSDANPLGQGKTNVTGQMLDTENIEVSCENGMGYLISSIPRQPAQGYTCIAAEHAAKQSQGSLACSLPGNASNTIAAAALSKLGKQCQVTATNWMGVDSSNEYIEIACTGGTGYVLTAAIPGKSTIPLNAMTCVEAMQKGIACKMSSGGPPPLTIETIKSELAKHNVPCNSTNLRSLGKETHFKRYLIEFQCPAEHPKGLVAAIPLGDTSAPFETMDCAGAAKKYNVTCEYAKP